VLNRDPNYGSAEQRRLFLLPAGQAQGYAQCFESYVADSYAAIDAQRSAVALPEALPTLRTEFAPPPSAMLSAAETATWTTVPEQGHATTTGRQS